MLGGKLTYININIYIYIYICMYICMCATVCTHKDNF